MNKNKLRNQYRRFRDQLSTEQIEQLSLEIANQSLQLPIWEDKYYHLFLSIIEKKEVNTEPLLHILQGKDKNIVVSKSDFSSGSLTHFLLTDNTVLVKNKWGIPEPKEGIEIPAGNLEVVFLPLLAFDTAGNRLGYGKGFYDRFLGGCAPGVRKIGLSFFPPEERIPDISPLDVPLDFCVTPSQIYDFKNL